MFRLSTFCLIALLLHVSHTFATEEAPTFELEKSDYSIGDMISLKLELEGKGFQLGAMDEEDLAPFELAGSKETYNPETNITTLTVRGHIFETGEITIPPLTILNKDGSSIKSEELKIVIKPVLKGDEKDIRAMKPQIAIDESGPLWPWLLAALLLILVVALTFYLKHLRGKKTAEEVAAIVIPPHIEALEEITKIEAMNLIREGRLKEFYTLVSDVIRVFEGRSYGFDAMEMTTEELIKNIRTKARSDINVAGLNDADKENDLLIIEKFLSDCDMVKFAKYKPADMDISALTNRAREIIKKKVSLEKEMIEEAKEEAAELILQGAKPKGDKTDAT